VVRTRVGYAGGTSADPTYHSLGDHTEAIEVDYDPAKLTYRDLLDVFWRDHDPRRPAHSRQYRSAIFYRTDAERLDALDSKRTAEALLGTVHTDVEPLDRFYVAEPYHQKYRLRNAPELMSEFRAIYPDDAGFVASTAAARVNGLLDGCQPAENLESLIASVGLSEGAGRFLSDRVMRPPGLLRLLR
jgi:peptide-methionine (S)-S-oxide reductase